MQVVCICVLMDKIKLHLAAGIIPDLLEKITSASQTQDWIKVGCLVAAKWQGRYRKGNSLADRTKG